MKYKLLHDYSNDEVDKFIFDMWNLDYIPLNGVSSPRTRFLILDEDQAVILKLKFSDLDLIPIHNPNSESQNLI